MEVILKQSIPSLGKAGDVVNIANGYGRNFLLPQGKAVFADKKNVVRLKNQQASIIAKASREKGEFEALASRLSSLDISIPVRVGDEERLYGSVTNMDIAKAIESLGYTIDRKKIQLEESVKTLGEFEVSIKLSPDVTASVKINVIPEEA